MDEALEAGSPISSSVMIDDAASAPDVLAYATVRILQELLTNTRKHAPHQPVKIRISGGATTGLTMEVSNRMGKRGSTGDPGSGLHGIRSRADAMGGWMEVEEGNDTFTVHVWMPWEVPAST